MVSRKRKGETTMQKMLAVVMAFFITFVAAGAVQADK